MKIRNLSNYKTPFGESKIFNVDFKGFFSNPEDTKILFYNLKNKLKYIPLSKRVKIHTKILALPKSYKNISQPLPNLSPWYLQTPIVSPVIPPIAQQNGEEVVNTENSYELAPLPFNFSKSGQSRYLNELENTPKKNKKTPMFFHKFEKKANIIKTPKRDWGKKITRSYSVHVLLKGEQLFRPSGLSKRFNFYLYPNNGTNFKFTTYNFSPNFVQTASKMPYSKNIKALPQPAINAKTKSNGINLKTLNLSPYGKQLELSSSEISELNLNNSRSYLGLFGMFNTETGKNRQIIYKFKKKNYKFNNSIHLLYSILKHYFKAMRCIISKFYIIKTPYKIKLSLFYYSKPILYKFIIGEILDNILEKFETKLNIENIENKENKEIRNEIYNFLYYKLLSLYKGKKNRQKNKDRFAPRLIPTINHPLYIDSDNNQSLPQSLLFPFVNSLPQSYDEAGYFPFFYSKNGSKINIENIQGFFNQLKEEWRQRLEKNINEKQGSMVVDAEQSELIRNKGKFLDVNLYPSYSHVNFCSSMCDPSYTKKKNSFCDSVEPGVKSLVNEKKNTYFMRNRSIRAAEDKILGNEFNYNKILMNIINKLKVIFKLPIEIELVRLYYPFSDSNIFVNVISYINHKYNIYFLCQKTFNLAKIKNPTIVKKKNRFSVSRFNIFINPHGLTNYKLIYAFLSGINIKVAGRLLREPSIPRKTLKVFQIGTLARTKADIVERGRVTQKNKRGAFSITIHTGHAFL